MMTATRSQRSALSLLQARLLMRLSRNFQSGFWVRSSFCNLKSWFLELLERGSIRKPKTKINHSTDAHCCIIICGLRISLCLPLFVKLRDDFLDTLFLVYWLAWLISFVPGWFWVTLFTTLLGNCVKCSVWGSGSLAALFYSLMLCACPRRPYGEVGDYVFHLL